MSRLSYPRRRIWVLLVLAGLIPYCLGAEGCPFGAESQPSTTGTGQGGGNEGAGQPIPTVDQPPKIAFAGPAANSSYLDGDSIVVTFSANDPENDFTWELFYDQDGTFNGNEISIQSGTRKGSSLVQLIWLTQGIAPGRYYLEAMVTDSGSNTDRAVVGPITLTAPATAGAIQVTSPASSVAVAIGATVNVVFAATNPGPNDTIDVFYDTDDDFNNGVAGNIASGLDRNATSAVWNTTGVPAGVYFIGASLGSGTSGRVARYAPGQVTTGQPLQPTNENDLTGLELTITQPSGSPPPIGQGATLTITFTAKDPKGTATVDLYYVQMNADGSTPSYTGNEPKIITGLAVTATSYLWTVPTTLASGVYRIGGTIGRSATARLSNLAPGKVLIATGAGGGGGGGGSYSISFPLLTSKIWVNCGGKTAVLFSTGGVSGMVRLFYALDINQDHKPDESNPDSTPKWVPLATANASVGSADFAPRTLRLTTGTYTIKGQFVPADGSKTVEAVAQGWVAINNFWVGDLSTPSMPGAVFEGVNYYDLAGSSLTPIKDLDGDGYDDFIIVSQFGKPGWDGFGIEGASVGEAYVIYGGTHLGQHNGPWRLNATGVNDLDPITGLPVNGLPGLVITGLDSIDSSPPSPADRGGISGVMAIPDQDGDGRPEIILSFPKVNNWGTNGGLARNGQFLRGGYVEISSTNPLIGHRSGSGNRTYASLWVGQDFIPDAVTPRVQEDFFGCKADTTLVPPNPKDCSICCVKKDGPYGSKDSDCQEEKPGCFETIVDHGIGFTKALADPQAFLIWNNDPYGATSPYYSDTWPPYGSHTRCACPALPAINIDPVASWPGCDADHSVGENSTGFDTGTVYPPYGLRMIGQADGDNFAWSMSFVDDMLLVGAPNKATYGKDNGMSYRLQLSNKTHGLGYQYGFASSNGSIFDLQPGPRPYQYVVVERDNCMPNYSYGSSTWRFYNTASKGSGDPSDPPPDPNRVGENLGFSISGVADMNGDGLGDVAIGAPNAFSKYDASGAVYLVYRRMPALDADRDLRKIELGALELGRRIGVMIRGRAGEGFGGVVGTGADINGDSLTEQLDLDHDGRPDLVMGNPHHNGDLGEVVILFGNPDLQSPLGGFRIDDLLGSNGLGTVIKGEQQGDSASFNIGYAGDFDGDGKPDLLVSAPGASASVDANGDGQNELLPGVGKVYLIFGSNKFERGKVYSLAMVGQPDAKDFNASDPDPNAYKKKGIKGLVFVGREKNDALGGGEEFSWANGGIGASGYRARNVVWAGDVNGDGYDDILIGAPNANVGDDTKPPGAIYKGGEAYLIFGYAVPGQK